jgi:acyl-CoA reductase-like NAD-dependent aldehyde dehydrogenase
VENPSTQEVIAVLPDLPVELVREAITTAEIAQVDWARRTARERSDILMAWHRLWIEAAFNLATIFTARASPALEVADLSRLRQRRQKMSIRQRDRGRGAPAGIHGFLQVHGCA